MVRQRAETAWWILAPGAILLLAAAIALPGWAAAVAGPEAPESSRSTPEKGDRAARGGEAPGKAGKEAPDPDAEEDPEGPLVPPGPDPDLVFIYTGRVRGFVEPCGCPRNPAGGLSRRAGYLDLLRKQYPKARVILVETGNFAAEFDEPGRLKTRTYIQGLSEFGYDVVGLGERELAGGLDAFDEVFEGREFPLVSATFTTRGTEETFVDPWIVKEYELGRRRKIRVGFIGLTSFNSRFASVGGGDRGVVSRDPVAQARRYLPQMAKESDFVVLLANMSGNEIRRVLEAVPGTVDLVLAAFSERISPRAMEDFAGVPTLFAGDQGRRLGEVRVFLEKKGEVSRLTSNLIHLTRRYPEVPRYERMIGTMLLKVNELMKAQAAASSGVPGDRAARGVAAPAGSLPDQYAGSAKCLSCHRDEFRVWEHSRHAHAMQTLVNANQDYNPECVACHTTGYGQPAGFRTASATPGLANVQCEACHGAGSAHVGNTSASYGSVPPRVCFSCHTRENSPDFSFFKYWSLIKH